MHNSLHIRPLLRAANADPVRRDHRDPHRHAGLDPQATAGDGEFRLADTWTLVLDLPEDVASAVRADLADFLPRFGIVLADDAAATLRVGLDPELAGRSCRLVLAPDAIGLAGGDVAGVWAAIAWFERGLRVRRGPFLPRGEIERPAAWAVQISQTPWGANYSVPDFSREFLDDDGFRLYAHYGVNSMMIYGDLLCYVNSSILPELNCPDYAANIAMLRDAARRAARYGVRFTYVPVGPKLRPDHPVFAAHPEVRGAGIDRGSRLHFLCSSHPSVLAFYEETFANLYAAVPELAGVVLITYSESFYHCRMWDRLTGEPCRHCAELPVHRMVADLVDTVARGVRRGDPGAFAAMWVYTWLHGDRRDLFRQLAPEVGVFHHVDKDHAYRKNGYTKQIWDYSIDYRGPTPTMVHLADLAHAEDRPLFVKTETGIGLETIQFPYVPALQHLAGKWAGVRGLRPHGVHQAWLFFGMCGSRAEELGLWAAYDGDRPATEFLAEMARRDFGPAAVPAALAAWECVSRAVTHIPCLHLRHYYVGPCFLGPAHPLVPHRDDPVPEVFDAYLFYLQEGEETFSVRQIEEARTCLVMRDLPASTRDVQMTPDDPDDDGWTLLADEFAAAAAEAEAAVRHLESIDPATPGDRANLREEQLLTELVQRTFLACANTVRFLQARNRRDAGDPDGAAAMAAIARDERSNALAARPVYLAAPWLDIKLRTDGHYSSCVAMIDAKVAWIDAFLDS